MARHVLVVLLVAVCVLQVVLSVPARQRRDAETSTAAPNNILEGLQNMASDIVKNAQEFFSPDSMKKLQATVTQLVNQTSASFSNVLGKDKTESGSEPAASSGGAPAAS